MHGEIHFRHDGNVHLQESVLENARTFFAALEGDPSGGFGTGERLSAPSLVIEDTGTALPHGALRAPVRLYPATTLLRYTVTFCAVATGAT